MVLKLSVDAIQRLGFEWPKYALIEKYCVVEDGEINLTETLEKMRSSQTFYQQQLNAAFTFKQQTGADYSDFTDRFDEYARMRRELGTAIAYIEEIMAASPEG